MTKISSLESAFRAAVDWLSATGQGVTDETSLRGNIIERCPEYYELFNTMHSRISTRAQLLNTYQHFRKDDTESDGCSSSDESTADLNSNPRRETPDPMSKRSATIPMSITQPQNKRPRKDDFASHPALLQLKQAQLDKHRDLQLAELDVRKKEFNLREKEFVARQKQLDNDVLLAAARIDEANAQATKL
ncbi:hypothetical protein PR001_g25843 [Phytophthora rubi]|uniref:Uncharacterized protein n=2 Tax=Phytophthora rubi TaxID=129364 RepID=A0A6A3HWJ3_9STRA|nr:hypothetical protein PR001_g25843 [Phytophthora rubi]